LQEPAVEQASDRLTRYLVENGIEAVIVAPGVPMPTVPLAATAIGVEVDQIVKSVLFVNRGGDAVLAIASGVARIDRALLGAVTGLEGLRLAGPDAVLAITGYPAGGVAPVGHLTPVPVVIDQRVMDLPLVYGGAGSESSLLAISPADIFRLTNATVASVTQPI
jgi:prolyl-tRNA editing enzyme YbaK/EbsC (Cys-tRNA(Pro) deacylase)